MKRIIALVFCLIFVFTVSSCNTENDGVKEKDRVIVSVGDTSPSYTSDRFDLGKMVSLKTDFAVMGKITHVGNGQYTTLTGNDCWRPIYPNTINVEKTFYGDIAENEDFTFGAMSGYVSYKLYLEKENLSEKYLTGEDYEKYKDDPNAFMELHWDSEPIHEVGDHVLIFGNYSDQYGYEAVMQIIFENGVTAGSEFFEDGTSYAQVCSIIEGYAAERE